MNQHDDRYDSSSRRRDDNQRYDAHDETRIIGEPISDEDKHPETRVFPPYADEDFAVRDNQAHENQQYPPRQDYVTRQELLEADNQRLHQELDNSNASLKTALEENESLQQEFANKSRALWIAIAVLAILMLIAAFFAFSQSDGSEKPEDASQSQSLSDAEAERDDANRRADDAEAQRSSVQSQLDEQTSRANDAEREIEKQKRDIADREREIEQLEKRLSDAERASSETVTQTVTTTVQPEPDNGATETGGGLSDLFNREPEQQQ